MCNKDCFNCIQEDCINDEITTEDYQRSEYFDKNLNITEKQRYHRRKTKEYYKQNRNTVIEKKKQYYQENREKEIDRVSKWVKENRERRNQYLRDRYRKKTERVS